MPLLGTPPFAGAYWGGLSVEKVEDGIQTKTTNGILSNFQVNITKHPPTYPNPPQPMGGDVENASPPRSPTKRPLYAASLLWKQWKVALGTILLEQAESD